MHDVSTLLRQKEQELARLQKEVDALRLVAIMFDRKVGDTATTTETARVPSPISAKPPSLPPLEIPAAAVSNNPTTATVASADPFSNGAAKRFP